MPPPSNKNIVGSKWVFKIKRHSDGTITRYKARLGFKSSADPSLFLYFHNTTIIYLLLYVDHTVISSNSPSSIASLITSLSLEFELKDLGSTLCYFLGLQLALTSSSLSITLTKYATGLLHKHNMFHSKPSKTPFATARLSPTVHSPC